MTCALCGKIPAPVAVELTGPNKRARVTGDGILSSWHFNREVCEPCSDALLRKFSLATRDRHLGCNRDCAACNGEGRRGYGSGSTWRGGMGTASMAVDQCDVCWGSGSQSEPWPNVRELEKAAADKALRNELSGFAFHCKMSAKNLSDGFRELLRVIEAQERRRKLPDGVDAFWYQQTVIAFAAQLRRYLEAGK